MDYGIQTNLLLTYFMALFILLSFKKLRFLQASITKNITKIYSKKILGKFHIINDTVYISLTP